MKQPVTFQENDKLLGKALYELYKILMDSMRKNDPEEYNRMMKRNKALRAERLAREKRLKIESQRPVREY